MLVKYLLLLFITFIYPHMTIVNLLSETTVYHFNISHGFDRKEELVQDIAAKWRFAFLTDWITFVIYLILQASTLNSQLNLKRLW